jgi:hypothetical protein
MRYTDRAAPGRAPADLVFRTMPPRRLRRPPTQGGGQSAPRPAPDHHARSACAMRSTTITNAPLGHDSPRALPIQVRPRPSDTVDSYIQRLARANHLHPDNLHGYLCPTPGHRGRSRLEHLAAASGRSVRELQRALIDLRRPRCGLPQPPPAQSGRRARWCSPACRKTAFRTRQSRPEPVTNVDSICEHCGSPVRRHRAAPSASGASRGRVRTLRRALPRGPPATLVLAFLPGGCMGNTRRVRGMRHCAGRGRRGAARPVVLRPVPQDRPSTAPR